MSSSLHQFSPIHCSPLDCRGWNSHISTGKQRCRRQAARAAPAAVPVPVKASVTPHRRRYTYYNKMFKPICYALPQPLRVSLV